ncbi:hypothetical protein [Acinetobacter brisouii]|uniref:hypothetical protein n=1 Tax=Acinetobacter brisouii TaxID=396323 RepID=UPI0005F7EF41|nr:hypothetical protein [Acinetobacter brisouii]KJV39742.1 hypothetical protein VH98_04470 [Acinetobacter brisouii]
MSIFSGLNRERYGPIVSAAAASIICLMVYVKYDLSLTACFTDKKAEFLSVGISLGAIWAGFIGVIMGLFMTLSNTIILEKLKNSGYINDLHSYLISSIKGSILFSMISFVGFFFLLKYFEYYFCIWLGSIIYAGMTFLRAANISYSIMKKVHE